MCHLPPGTENRCVPGLWGGGGGCSAYYGINWGEGGIKGGNGRRCGGGGDWTNTLAASPGGGGGYDGTNTLAASPGGGGQTPWRHPRGGGGDGTNTLVQPHYPTPTKSVNSAGARGGKARDNNQGEAGGGDSKET